MENVPKNKPEPDTVLRIDRTIADKPKDYIPGWGIDADPKNDPTYPMKHWNGADHQRFNYPKPPQQPIDIDVFHSIERPGITRVFGTSTPPRGLSGLIRGHAYTYSEATTAHWMTLLLADRVNVVEGLVEDVLSGHVPNIFKERGWQSEWKYNRKGFIQTAAVGTVVTVALVLFLSRKKKPRPAL